MKTCKHCGKTLVGKEKSFCKSCKDKGLDNAKKVTIGAFTFAAATLFVKTKGKDVVSIATSILKR